MTKKDLAERWATWNQILNYVRRGVGNPLVPASNNPYAEKKESYVDNFSSKKWWLNSCEERKRKPNA